MSVFLRILPILGFFLLLLAPTLAAATGYPRYELLQENRKLAEKPVPAAYFGAGKFDFLGFTEQVNRSHLDTFKTRPLWVRLRTQVLYSLFRESDQVHVGRDNWLFYRTVIDVETPQIELITPETRKQFIDRMARLTELLAQRDIRLYVMPVALKNYYYPEYLPGSAAHAHKFRFFDTYLDEMTADGRLNVVDSRAVLKQAKASGVRIFHQTDFHWTDAAAPIAARSMLQDIAEREGLRSLVDSWNYEIVPMPGFSGGQARALPLLRSPTETTVGVKLNGPLTEFDVVSDQNNIEIAGVARPGQPPRLSPVFVYGDSFFDAELRAGFFNFFSAYGRARLYRNDLVEAFRNRPQGTRYMVLEWISSGTYGMDNYVTALIAALEADPAL